MKPRIMASSPEISITTRRSMSSSVIGMESQALRGKAQTRRTPRIANVRRDETGKALATPERGGNVDLKCLIL